jgi:hypothetical protein
MGLFSNLPAELLEAIVAGLCIECRGGEERCCFSYNCCTNTHPDDVKRISALASLCLTSRKLNSVATRHLYHHLDGRRWWLTARTLLARKDLAQLTKSIRTCFHPGIDQVDCSPEVLAYFHSHRRAYLDRSIEDGYYSNLKDEELYNADQNIPFDLLTSLCRHLETLQSFIGGFETFYFCTPQSHPRLRFIALSYGDTEYGFNLKHVAPLLGAAPNLTTALFNMASSCSWLDMTLPNLTSLEFQSSTFNGPSLVNILSACPNLETFRYEMGGALVGYEQFSISEARDAFFAHAPRLKKLSLEAGDNDHCDEDWEDDEAEEFGRLLKERGVEFEYKPYVWAS